MLSNCARISVLAAVVASLVVAGCGSQQAKTTPPADQPKIGVIDMDKAVKAHPRYAEAQRLQKEYASLAVRLDAERSQGSAAAGQGAGLEQAAAKEFAARMAAKEAELRTRLEAAVDQARRDMASELDAYARELDKDYQPRLFSLQLKLKTVQLSQEEMTAVQAEATKLQQERAAKITARQQELFAKSDAAIKAKQGEGEKELAAYARALNDELVRKVAGQQAEAAGRNAALGQAGGSDAEKLAALGRDIAALQEAIIADIRDKAAHVATRQGLGAVLAAVQVNVSAADITDTVIDEFKK